MDLIEPGADRGIWCHGSGPIGPRVHNHEFGRMRESFMTEHPEILEFSVDRLRPSPKNFRSSCRPWLRQVKTCELVSPCRCRSWPEDVLDFVVEIVEELLDVVAVGRRYLGQERSLVRPRFLNEVRGGYLTGWERNQATAKQGQVWP